MLRNENCASVGINVHNEIKYMQTTFKHRDNTSIISP